MSDVLALVAFSFVSSVTPGPNNALLWASGAEFGLRRSVSHVVGTGIGLAAMAIAAAAGLGVLITSIAGLEFALKVIGSVYLAYIAFRMLVGGAFAKASTTRPLGVVQAAGFQLANPKAWVFAVAAVSTFRPSDLPVVAGSALVAAVMFVMVIITAAMWAAGGKAMNRVVSGDPSRRAVNATLAVILAVSIIYVWI